jgi:outer membrane protein
MHSKELKLGNRSVWINRALGLLQSRYHLALLLLASFAATSAHAQEIYVVDVARVVSESIAGKAARSNVEAEAKRRQIALEKPRAEIEKMQADIQKQGSLLSQDALLERQQTLRRKEQELRTKIQDERAALSTKNEQEISKVVKLIDASIAELAQEKGYRVVLERDRQLVLYAAQRYDITQQVIELIDQKKLNL